MSEIRLQVQHVSKSFGITKALKDVSFNIYKGEVHALIGENGSGKSTLTNSLTGIYQKDSGAFILDGKEIHPKNQVEANNEGVSIIVQELGTLDGLTVAENIFLGHEDRFVKMGIKNTNAMNREANDLLKKYGFDRIKAGDMVENYNFEDRKLVEIVKATYFGPKIVVIDETTTALSQEGREELYKQMNRIRDEGNTVIFISHDLPEVLRMSDTITVLRDGDYIDTVKSSEIDEDGLKKLMVGREVTGDYYRADYGEKVSDEVVMSVKNVTVPGLIENITFDLHKGEILGFGGLSESGMHEVGKACFGASFDRQGTVTLADGTPINDIPTAIKHSIAYTSKDRDNESIVMNQSIRDNIVLPSLDKLAGPAGMQSDKKQKDFANKFAAEMSTKMQSVEQFVSDLSGGNKQKVVLARWIGADSDILVLDSPTRGIDIKVKQDIYQLMDRMRKSGKSIIMISEELMELIGWSKEETNMATNAAAVSKEDQLKKQSTMNMVRAALPIIGLVVVFIVFNILTKGGMWNSRKLILNQIYVTMISATGVFFIMTMGGLDFSQGSIMGMASITVCVLSKTNIFLAILGGILTGAAIGAFNGFFYVNRKIKSYVPVPRRHQVSGVQFTGRGFHGRL